MKPRAFALGFIHLLFPLFHRQLAVFGIDLDGTIAVESACKEFLREVVEQEALDGSLDGTRSEVWVVAFVSKQVDGFIAYLQSQAILFKHLLNSLDLQADNLLHFAPVQGMEDDNLVDSVQELGTNATLYQQTVRPFESVRRPSSSTCSRVLKTSGCAFSISSKSTT